MRRRDFGSVRWSALTLIGTLAACVTPPDPDGEERTLHANQAEIGADHEQYEGEEVERSSDMNLQNALSDDALRSLLLDAYVTPPVDPRLNISHPWGETFDARGIYFKTEGRIRREGTFEIADGMVCVEGPSIDRRCRRVVPNADGTYTFINNSDGVREVLVVTQR